MDRVVMREGSGERSFFEIILGVLCPSCIVLGIRRTRCTRYETRRDTEPKPERGLVTPERSSRRGRGRMRVGRDKRAHALRLHRGIRWLDSSRSARRILAPVSDAPPKKGICKIPPTIPDYPKVSTSRICFSISENLEFDYNCDYNFLKKL